MDTGEAIFPAGDCVKATAGTRTQDLSFTKASLYQLSYGGIQQITAAEINIFLIDFIDD